MLKKWRITAADRSGWARLRMREAEEGLARLGAAADCMELLGYPDQRLASVARLHRDRIIAELETRVSDFDPTLVVVPSSFDIHADHRAAAFFAHRAVADPSRIVTYVVHGKAPAERTHFTLHLLESERRRKREAIEVHTTQLLLGRERYLSYARTTETFYRSEEDLVRVDTASRELGDTMRHAAHAVRRSIAARLFRRSDR
jgi:LmbE family N-acetylglucosaminyl deacetylase